MQMEFVRKMPLPQELIRDYPIGRDIKQKKEERDRQIAAILTGEDSRLLLLIGPCSADREDAVLDYMGRLARLNEEVRDRLMIVPRVYTNKPRTKGVGYKGMLHQPDPGKGEDLLAGIIAIREMHTRILRETGFSCADEMLYPENYRFLSDLLGYVAIGARSVENQQHRLVSSGLNVPVGMKNPTGGDLSVMMNAITAAQHSHTFLFTDWEVQSHGNPLTHAILRGYVDKEGHNHPNYHYEDIENLLQLYAEKPDLENPGVVIDCNHSNSGKKYEQQIRIAKEIMHQCILASEIRSIVKGLMIESYLEDGSQRPEEGVYGKSITDPCLGWEKTEKLIYELAELR